MSLPGPGEGAARCSSPPRAALGGYEQYGQQAGEIYRLPSPAGIAMKPPSTATEITHPIGRCQTCSSRECHRPGHRQQMGPQSYPPFQALLRWGCSRHLPPQPHRPAAVVSWDRCPHGATRLSRAGAGGWRALKSPEEEGRERGSCCRPASAGQPFAAG